MKAKAESCSKQLKGWAESIQNSDYKGERYVTEKVKRSDKFARERDEFLKGLQGIQKKGAESRNQGIETETPWKKQITMN